MRQDHAALLAILALGLAAPAAGAQTPEPKTKPAAAEPAGKVAKPSSVEGLTVDAPRARPGPGVPADKAAAYDAEVAKDEAWRSYRRSTPPLTKDPNDMSKDFPGLQAYVPPK